MRAILRVRTNPGDGFHGCGSHFLLACADRDRARHRRRRPRRNRLRHLLHDGIRNEARLRRSFVRFDEGLRELAVRGRSNSLDWRGIGNVEVIGGIAGAGGQFRVPGRRLQRCDRARRRGDRDRCEPLFWAHGKRQLGGLADIAAQRNAQQRGDPLAIILGPGLHRPVADSRVEQVGRDVLRCHQSRLAPAPVERISIGKVLAHLGGIVTCAQRIGEYRHPAARIAGERDRQAKVARGDRILPQVQHGLCLAILARTDIGQRQAERGERRFIAQSLRILERRRCRFEAPDLQICVGQRKPRRERVRGFLYGPLSLRHGLAVLFRYRDRGFARRTGQCRPRISGRAHHQRDGGSRADGGPRAGGSRSILRHGRSPLLL